MSNNENGSLEVVITADNVPLISSFYCPREDLEMILEIANKKLVELKKTSNYKNPRIEVRDHDADL